MSGRCASEIRKARGRTSGLIGVNIMVAVNDFQQLLDGGHRRKGGRGCFMGAGLPIKNIPVARIRSADVLVVPIVSSGRAAELIFRYWEKTYNDVPDGVVVEGPLAGGHLGFKADNQDADHALEIIVPEVIAAVAPSRGGVSQKDPGHRGREAFHGRRYPRFLQLGAAGVQMATRFVATDECDADLRFKEAYIALPPGGYRHHQEPGRAAGTRHPQPLPGQRRRRRAKRQPLRLALPGALRHPARRLLHFDRAGQRPAGHCSTRDLLFCGANAYRVDKIVPVRELVDGLKSEYEAAFLKGLVTLKDEYLGAIEARFASLRREYERARQRIIRLGEECGRTWDRKIVSLKGDYEKAHELVNRVKKEYESAFEKLNELKVRFPEKVAELQAIARCFQNDLLLAPTNG